MCPWNSLVHGVLCGVDVKDSVHHGAAVSGVGRQVLHVLHVVRVRFWHRHVDTHVWETHGQTSALGCVVCMRVCVCASHTWVDGTPAKVLVDADVQRSLVELLQGSCRGLTEGLQRQSDVLLSDEQGLHHTLRCVHQISERHLNTATQSLITERKHTQSSQNCLSELFSSGNIWTSLKHDTSENKT